MNLLFQTFSLSQDYIVLLGSLAKVIITSHEKSRKQWLPKVAVYEKK